MKFKIFLVLVSLVGLYFLYTPRIEYVEVEVEKIITITRNESTLIKERVAFTSFWTGDSMKSGAITHSGLRISDFSINRNGWYTYKGMVVVATATNQCLESTSGACGRYMERKDTHHYFDLFDTLTIIINGKEYDAIVLDSCGACFWDEAHQRIDIFVASKQHSVGKTVGAILY